MGRFNELLHGTVAEVLAALDAGELSEAEMRAALTNAFSRLERIEKTLAAISSASSMRLTG